MSTHAVLGAGGDHATASVITDGLKDTLKEGDTLLLPWYGPPADNLEVVYDYVLAQEIPFNMYYTDRPPPPVFADAPGVGDLINTENIPLSLATGMSEGATLLVLFHDDADLTDDVLTVLDNSISWPVDLSNGLLPLEIYDDGTPAPEPPAPEPTSPDVKEEDSLESFTRTELEGLSLKILKRAAEPLTEESITEKEHAIAVILGEPWPPAEEDTDEEGEVVTLHDLKQVVAAMEEQLAKLKAMLK